ncbi:MAG TPA: hypothetical protein VMW25_04125 [Clostridia bacterium]|nr:hypothetical protein [Clostridia bacterium]
MKATKRGAVLNGQISVRIEEGIPICSGASDDVAAFFIAIGVNFQTLPKPGLPAKATRQGKPVRNQRTGKLTQGFLAVQSASRSRNGVANIDDIMSRTLEDPVWKEKWNPKDPCLAVWQALYNEQKEGRIVNEKRGVWRVTGKGFRWLETRAASF